jgi:hypothetical protein
MCQALTNGRRMDSCPDIAAIDVMYASEVMRGELLNGRAAVHDDGRFTFEGFRDGAGKACFTAQGRARVRP